MIIVARSSPFDKLCNALSNYHTIETNPQRLLNKSLIHSYSILETRVNRKKIELLIPWTSSIPKRLIRNTIKTELHRVKRISSNFVNQITLTGNKFKTPFVLLTKP